MRVELAVQVEKRVMMRRGISPSERVRQPTLLLDEAYQKQMDDLVDAVAGLAAEAKVAQSARAPAPGPDNKADG